MFSLIKSKNTPCSLGESGVYLEYIQITSGLHSQRYNARKLKELHVVQQEV